MRVFLVAVFCAVVLSGVVADVENEVRRGSFPFMAILYYTDETVIEDGARFTRSAALISENWLISSGDVSVAFPNKTLLARLGAVNIDQKFTLNEDEGEQEREIILILRSYNYSMTEWWKTDISLQNTLLPFNITSFVASAALVSNPDIMDKNCYILVYTKTNNNATERSLMQMYVDILPPTHEECGNYFKKETMACAADSEKNNSVADSNFCQGNRGGPLFCDNELTGIQTYINDCKQPHLYQLLIRWKKFINCAADQRYLTQQCSDVSIAIHKDPPTPSTSETSNLPEMISEILGGKFYNNTYYPVFDVDTSEPSTISKVEESTGTSGRVELKSIEIKTTEVQVTTTTTTLLKNYSNDTTLYTTVTDGTYTEKEKEAITQLDSTEERERKTRIEEQRQLVRGKSSVNVPSLFFSLMIVSILAYT